ncbi:alpha/beta fold hydrolase [Cobetia amphilecti]|uniref:alpha/beta fold hydrolase n=1 Tax=Cobetia amphilecti TaxID=1055104 RepID=UPI0026E42C60|nr:alpha/beta fold hydrolase [Cobetia amphilecti]MDO6815649.1 alpha/beta fold hydrolase [Cobetia amphilecti]
MTLTRLVLFSGWGIDARIWQPLIACLQARLAHATETNDEADDGADDQAKSRPLEIIAPDWPEEGPQAESRAGSEPTASRASLGGADTLWLGWSLGALRAEALAKKQAPAALVSLAMGPSFIHQAPSEQTIPALTPEVLDTFRAAFARNPTASWQHFLRWQANGETSARDCLRQLRELIGRHPVSREAVLSAGLAELASRQMSLAPQSELPLEFWLGKQDPLLAPGLNAALRAQGQVVAEFEGGHCLPLSATEALADALLTRMGLATHHVTRISEEA